MESNVNYITFLVLIITVMLSIMFLMISTILNTIKAIGRLIEAKNNPDTQCNELPVGFVKVEGINTSYRKRYVYVKNVLAHDEFFIYDTNMGRLVKVNLDPEIIKYFKPEE